MIDLDREDGFTLPELLVAITILGIIMVAIGAMISTSFRTSTTVGAELQSSRAPKMMSRYWIPDSEQAESVDTEAPCGTGGNAIVTFGSHIAPSAFTPASSPDDLGALRRVTWRRVVGSRDQLVRSVCDGNAAPESTVVVSQLKEAPTVDINGASYTLHVKVPDRSRTDDEVSFDVTGMSQITPATGAP